MTNQRYRPKLFNLWHVAPRKGLWHARIPEPKLAKWLDRYWDKSAQFRHREILASFDATAPGRQIAFEHELKPCSVSRSRPCPRRPSTVSRTCSLQASRKVARRSKGGG